jgi:hypothetical protein
MPANQAPIFTLVPVATTASVSAANTARDGTGTLVTLLSAGANGTRLDRLVATATGQTAAAQLLLFVNDGTTSWLFKELTISAVTAGPTTAAATTELVRTDGLPIMAIPSGYSIKFCLTVAPVSGQVNVTAHGGHF